MGNAFEEMRQKYVDVAYRLLYPDSNESAQEQLEMLADGLQELVLHTVSEIGRFVAIDGESEMSKAAHDGDSQGMDRQFTVMTTGEAVRYAVQDIREGLRDA